MVVGAGEPEPLAGEDLSHLLAGRVVITDHEVDVAVRAGLPAKQSIDAPPACHPRPDFRGGQQIQDREHPPGGSADEAVLDPLHE